jgi:hypothetical protein
MTATLASVGVSDELIGGDGWRVIAESPPELHEMGETYQAVNDHLDSLLRRGPLSIAHITGEARAIVDPAHRRVVRRVAEYGQQVSVACTFDTQGDDRPDAWRFVARQHQHWGRMRWFDLIDVLELAASRLIRICWLAHAEDVHFSIFGHDLVLLQERHHHPTAEKWVWYVQSAALAEALRPHLDRLLDGAVTIDPTSFDEILDWLNQYETFIALRTLASGQRADTDLGDRAVSDRPDTRLLALGLTEQDGGSLTSLGREWLERITDRTQSG